MSNLFIINSQFKQRISPSDNKLVLCNEEKSICVFDIETEKIEGESEDRHS